MKKSFVIIFLLASFLMIASCKNVKDALSGAKKNSSDEFLVKLLKVVENEKKESSEKNSSIEEFVIRNINKN